MRATAGSRNISSTPSLTSPGTTSSCVVSSRYGRTTAARGWCGRYTAPATTTRYGRWCCRRQTEVRLDGRRRRARRLDRRSRRKPVPGLAGSGCAPRIHPSSAGSGDLANRGPRPTLRYGPAAPGAIFLFAERCARLAGREILFPERSAGLAGREFSWRGENFGSRAENLASRAENSLRGPSIGFTEREILVRGRER